jgi:hypothetical protein
MRAVVGVEVGLLVADRGSAADQRADRIEQALDVFNGLVAEALDEPISIGARDPVVRQVSEADDRQEPWHRQQHKQRDDARLQPQFSCEWAFHVLAAPASRSRSAGEPPLTEVTTILGAPWLIIPLLPRRSRSNFGLGEPKAAGTLEPRSRHRHLVAYGASDQDGSNHRKLRSVYNLKTGGRVL